MLSAPDIDLGQPGRIEIDVFGGKVVATLVSRVEVIKFVHKRRMIHVGNKLAIHLHPQHVLCTTGASRAQAQMHPLMYVNSR